MIQAIRARLKAATPGPWDGLTLSPTFANMDLLAHAPDDLEALCDEVERLQAAIDDALNMLDSLDLFGTGGAPLGSEEAPWAIDVVYDGARRALCILKGLAE
jgi:hypothetical protein